MARLVLLLLIALAIPLYLKFEAGDLEDLASRSWKSGPVDSGIVATLQAAGLSATGADQPLRYANADRSCEIDLSAADPQGQLMGYLENRAKTDGRLSYIEAGALHDHFPYRTAVYRHIRYIVLKGFGLDPDYGPFVAVFEPRPCSELDPLRVN